MIAKMRNQMSPLQTQPTRDMGREGNDDRNHRRLDGGLFSVQEAYISKEHGSGLPLNLRLESKSLNLSGFPCNHCTWKGTLQIRRFNVLSRSHCGHAANSQTTKMVLINEIEEIFHIYCSEKPGLEA
jgi:hypothetical protein